MVLAGVRADACKQAGEREKRQEGARKSARQCLRTDNHEVLDEVLDDLGL